MDTLTIKECQEMMASIRETISKIVNIRLELLKTTWQSRLPLELASANDELLEAIDGLYNVETDLGDAHQYLLIYQATARHDQKN